MAEDETLRDSGSQLCVSCGLCCDGALHDAAALLPEEISLALSLGMKVTQSVEDVRFSLPCHLLKDRCCTVYANRPSPCRNYKCRLLQTLEADESSLQQCLDKVSSARSLLSDLQDVLPQDMTLPEARASAASQPVEDVDKLGRAKIKLHAFALNVYLEKYFRNEYENSFLQTTSIDENNG